MYFRRFVFQRYNDKQRIFLTLDEAEMPLAISEKDKKGCGKAASLLLVKK